MCLQYHIIVCNWIIINACTFCGYIFITVTLLHSILQGHKLDGDYEKYRANAENCSKYPYQLSDKVFTENSLEKCLLNYIAVQQPNPDNTAFCQTCSLRSSSQDGTGKYLCSGTEVVYWLLRMNK